jgi:DNA-binding LacI/PurR family transcriptional regulator
MRPPGPLKKKIDVVTLADVAARCGVSKMTVSRALRDDGAGVEKERAELIRAVAAELGYSVGSGHAARQLVMRRRGERLLNHLIAVFLPLEHLDLPFFNAIYHGVIHGMRQEQFAMLTHYSTSADANDALLPFYERSEVDGALVLAGPSHFHPLLTRLRALRGFGDCPVVSLQHTFPGCAAVVVNERQGGYDATAHLLALGHRRLLHFWDVTSELHAQRHVGAQRACADAGLVGAAVLVAGGAWSYADPLEAARRFRAAWLAHPGCTAVLAPNDEGARLIAGELVARGVRVPDDVSLIGHDDCEPLLDAHGQNILTTVRLPLRELGYEGARLVARQVHEGASSEIVMLPTALQVRGTTAPARA